MTFNLQQKVCAAFFVVLIVFWFVLFTSGARESLPNYLFVFLYGLIPLFGGIAAIKGSKLWGGADNAMGKAVLFLGIGLTCFGIGETIWAYYTIFAGTEIPYPSAADIFFAPSVFFYALGAIFLSRTMGADLGLKSAFGKVFAIFAPAALLGITYYIFVGADGASLIEDGVSLKTVLDIAYPLGDFVALSVSVVVSGLSFRYLGGKHKSDVLLIMAGLAAMFAADAIFSYTTTIGTAYNGDFGDLAFTIGLFLLTCGTIGFNKVKNDQLDRF